MRSTKMFFTLSSITILHLGFLLPLLLFDSTSATKQCKSTVMNIIMKQCSGARFRRDIEGVPPAAEQNKEDAAPAEKEQHILGQQDKRQISSDLVSAMAEYAAPILSEALKNYASENAAPNLRRSNSAMVPRYGTSYNSPYVDRMSGYYNGYSSSPRLLSYGGEGGGGGFIPQFW